jgi:hypothetical protein
MFDFRNARRDVPAHIGVSQHSPWWGTRRCVAVVDDVVGVVAVMPSALRTLWSVISTPMPRAFKTDDPIGSR